MGAKIKDVAALAGVSVATVSRVLSNGPVSAALRQQVEAAVQQLGYRPNLSARRLRSQHSQTIGLIVADIRNPFFTAVSRAVEDVAYQAGMRVILCNADENPDKEAMYLRLMQEERVCGVIFSPTSVTARRFRPERFEFPVVMIDRAAPPGTTDTVVLDNRLAASHLTEHLLAQGYRRISGLFGNISATGKERAAGYCAALEAHGLKPDARFIAPGSDPAARAVQQLLQAPERPDALIASNGLLLLGAMQAVHATGLKMPQQIGLAGFDNDLWTGLVDDGLTVIEQPVADIGTMAMDMLLSRLQNPALSPRQLVLHGKLLARGSTRLQSA
ncbi:substrate-binding domain-containing protein [Paludibacterium sp. THUN1379]|uniref:LacI family DNA-binding transcriptional regulator n=1 Tax=Paludibacterium sp. THUN1379 TaxID=3112107 RepID=UPI0030919BB1|nr:substrate-binding domain-containing protein [Paludibacterium sp. THUN1379]